MSEVATDCHELMTSQHIMWPSIAHAGQQLGPAVQHTDIPPPNQLHYKLLLISRPAEGRRLSRPEHTVI